MVKPRGAYLGPAFMADAMAEGQQVCVGGWECLKAIAALELFASLLSLMIFSPGWKEQLRGSVVISGFTDNAGNEAVLNRLMTSKFPLVVILTELAEQVKQGEMDRTQTWVPREQHELADALTNGDLGNFRKENRMELDDGSLGFKILREMVRVADKVHADVKKHKEMGKDEGSRSGDGKTKSSERLRMRDSW